MISCVIYACTYDMVQKQNWHNGLTFDYQIWASNDSNSTIWASIESKSTIDLRLLKVQTVGTRDDLTPGLQLGLEPTTQALEIQRFNHYAMERSNKESTSLCIYYQLSWLAWRKKN